MGMGGGTGKGYNVEIDPIIVSGSYSKIRKKLINIVEESVRGKADVVYVPPEDSLLNKLERDPCSMLITDRISSIRGLQTYVSKVKICYLGPEEKDHLDKLGAKTNRLFNYINSKSNEWDDRLASLVEGHVKIR